MPATVPPPHTPDRRAWVIIPLYNEASVIADVITDLRREFTHVVCVDDGSSDGSARIAAEAGAHLVQHPVNLGQGAALQTGIEYALTHPDCEYLVTFDADGQHRIEDALGMFDAARAEDVAIVFGSRFLDDRTDPGWIKKVVLKTAVWVTNMTTSLKLTDAHNGLRVIRRDAAERIEKGPLSREGPFEQGLGAVFNKAFSSLNRMIKRVGTSGYFDRDTRCLSPLPSPGAPRCPVPS